MNYPQPTLASPQGMQARAPHDVADIALTSAARFWFAVAVIGQLLFVYYVLTFYGGAVAKGNLALWNNVLPRGYIAGDTVGNVAVGLHMLMAVVITVGGALQLIPQVRARAPRFHRHNGRVYVLLAVLASLIGLYMVWVRGSLGSVTQHVAISLNAVLIMLCAAIAVRHARAGRQRAHRRWALRLFLVVSGVWFFRVGLMLWIMLNQGRPVGFDPVTFQGPFLVALTFGQTLVPLAVLQLYLRARESAAAGRLAMAALLVALTVAMGAGIGAAALYLWLPHM